MPSTTVIEVARRAAHLSQRRLAAIAQTQQSSISEYERRRKSPTLDAVERLLDAAEHELAAKPIVFWEQIEDPDVGSFWVPDKLWSVPVPKCFAKVQAFKYVFPCRGHAGLDRIHPDVGPVGDDRTPDGEPDRWLFDEGGKPWHDNLVDYRWRSTRTDAGLAHKLHDLRHYFASGLIAAGCDVVTVQRAMGHSSATTTLSTYAHLWPTAEDKTRAAAAAMAAEVLATQSGRESSG